jgi:hypothetical protein
MYPVEPDARQRTLVPSCMVPGDLAHHATAHLDERDLRTFCKTQ